MKCAVEELCATGNQAAANAANRLGCRGLASRLGIADVNGDGNSADVTSDPAGDSMTVFFTR